MIYWTGSAPARPVSRALAATAKALATTRAITLAPMIPLTVALSVAAGPPALAQQLEPAPAPVAKPKPAKKAPKPAAPAAQRGAPPTEAQQAPSQLPPPQQGKPGEQQTQLIYSPWTKFCLKGQEANAKQVCFTGKDARIESGMPVVAAVLIEPEGQERKILRVTLPLGMQLVHGTRIIIDQGQPMAAPYIICFTNGCMSDYEANAELVGKLKKGQGLVVQAINSTGQAVSLVMPLADFAKAYDGPPTDPKVFEAEQRKLQEELQRRADEARKKLESQQGSPTSSAAPPPQAGKTQ